MEKTTESVVGEIAALRQALKDVSTAIDNYAEKAIQNVGNKSAEASGEVSELHKALFLKTSSLARTVRGPVDMLISHFEDVSIDSF